MENKFTIKQELEIVKTNIKQLIFLLLISVVSAFGADITISIQPFGTVDTLVIKEIIPEISKEYNNAIIKISNPADIPKSAYYAPRNRYRAEKLLPYLDSINDKKYYRIVGLTDKDISTTKDQYYDWGIFGLGNLDGYSCVISTFRLKKDGKLNLFRERLKKIVIHELGHTFGLEHCEQAQCVMTSYQGSIKILDNQSWHLCSSCRKFYGISY
jgi:archaemetzincin